MDASIQKALNDKLYDKRKLGALELERLVRECLQANNGDRIEQIIDQLCDDYAYAIHQPYARNGGLIGLAAASIALGTAVAPYLEKIVPPVLACFSDQDARVRYYACESMYNISKTSKGEILPYFNEVFDALAKLAADPELSVKNGAELLDRLIKDIISDSALSYVSVLHDHQDLSAAQEDDRTPFPTAFSLPRFIPLLKERVYVLNPWTRMFLVNWISLLDSIPDLELISYLPDFLGGLFRFLNDSNQDVVTSAQHLLERFLDEIKLIARVKRSSPPSGKLPPVDAEKEIQKQLEISEEADEKPFLDDSVSIVHDEWIPGQDLHVDHARILEILLTYLQDSQEEHIQLTALQWTDSFFDICPDEMLSFVPALLTHVLPCLSSDIEQVRAAGGRVNGSLTEYIIAYTEDDDVSSLPKLSSRMKLSEEEDRQSFRSIDGDDDAARSTTGNDRVTANDEKAAGQTLDYQAAVDSLTKQFLHEHEATRVAALSWLIMLQSKAPKKVLSAQDGTFPALLKTLADTSDAVVTRDLQLLSQISKNSDDSYFAFFMVNLLKLFQADRRLLESRGNLIIRQLCHNLSPERIYRMMADCLEREEDFEYASVMVQNLNNNLITAPELTDLRRRLRNWDARGDGQGLFVVLFKAWCPNAVATLTLCLLAQAYEQAYNILQTFADIEMTINMLIQIDKLVQLLESPVFTYLRLQLLEPERYPYLYKCLYGILMLLPQSAAFAALKNRLNSVSAIGYLHVPRPGVGTGPAASAAASTASAFDRANRIKARDDGPVKWGELLERFRVAQDRVRRADGRRSTVASIEPDYDEHGHMNPTKETGQRLLSVAATTDPSSRFGQASSTSAAQAAGKEHGHRSKLSMGGHLGRLTKGVKGPSKK